MSYLSWRFHSIFPSYACAKRHMKKGDSDITIIKHLAPKNLSHELLSVYQGPFQINHIPLL